MNMMRFNTAILSALIMLFSFSTAVSALTLKPPAPVLTTATAGNARVILKWNAVSTATGYTVKYGTTTGVYSTTRIAGNVTTFSVTGLTNGKTYYFVVVATNASGASGNSNLKSAKPHIPVPATPVLRKATPGNAKVVLNWRKVARATGYTIKYGIKLGVYTKKRNVGKVPTFVVKGLANGRLYYFVVSARNAGGSSRNSNVKSARPRASLPTAGITLQPTSINRGQSAALSWQCTNSATCTI